MTPRLLTKAEAVEFLETAFQITPEDDGDVVSEVVAGVDCQTASRVVGAYLDLMTGDIDRESVIIEADDLDDAPALDAVVITIRTREWE